MRLSLRAVAGARVAPRRRSGALLETSTVRLFLARWQGGSFRCRLAVRRGTWRVGQRGFRAAWLDPKGHQASSPAADAGARLEGHRRADLQADVGRQCRRSCRAGVAFYGFFALLSLLGLIVLAYGFAADPITVIEHMQRADRRAPDRCRLDHRRPADDRGQSVAEDQGPRDPDRVPRRDLRRHQRRRVGASPRSTSPMRRRRSAASSASICSRSSMTSARSLVALVRARRQRRRSAFLQHLLPAASPATRDRGQDRRLSAAGLRRGGGRVDPLSLRSVARGR